MAVFLETDRVVLRQFTPDDVDALALYRPRVPTTPLRQGALRSLAVPARGPRPAVPLTRGVREGDGRPAGLGPPPPPRPRIT